MNRRLLGKCVGLFFLTVNLVGCQTGQGLFHKMKAEETTDSKADESEVENETDKVLDVKSAKPKPFFKSSRLSSAMSDEGREIENDLGIH